MSRFNLLPWEADYSEAKSQPVVKKRPYGTRGGASGFMPTSSPCPCQLPGSCSPQTRQGKAETGSCIFHTCISLPTLLGEEGGKRRETERVCVCVGGESRDTLTALQIQMDAQVFPGVSKIQGSCENTKYVCATVSGLC